MITPGGNFMTLASFSGTNGAEPTANLVQGTDGHLYGTTLNGGMGFNGSLFSGFGTVFKITTNGVLETLVYLSSSNGIHPYDALVEGADGDFYGTASTGGTNSNSGSVFKVSANGAVTTIFYFNGANGSSPYAI